MIAVAKSRGQISTEILVVVGIMLTLLLPLILYSYGKVNVAKEDLAVQKAEFAAQRIASISDSVGYLGGAAAIIEEIEIPPGFRNLTINGHDIVIELQTSSGRKQIVKSTAFGLKGENSLANITSPGNYFIEARAIDRLDGEIGNGTSVLVSVK
ncbi:MAG: hypothetical protein NT051_03300 [Candidatus Micrarchaeota archaeon]|nr:hypothetical protein [Candidatus Micrarchaeota archaeon]